MSLSFDAIRFVLFDAVGTLIYPNPGAAEAYSTVGQRMGIRLSREEIAVRFPAALREHTEDSDQPTNEDRERDRWRKIVADVFRADRATNEALFQELWRNFGDSRQWAIYDDVEPAWSACQECGLSLGIASNFDSRLVGILRRIGDFGDSARWFYSSLVGYSKPNAKFFAEIAGRLAASPEEILLVGDDYGNDYLGARNAGWRVLWLDRKGERSDDAAVGERLENLRELAKLFHSRKKGDRAEE